MMRFKAGGLAPLLSPILLLAACTSPADLQGSNRQVTRRLQVRMAPDIAAGQAAVQHVPGTERVILPDQALFAGSATALDDNGRLVLARLIEGLLAPRIMRIDVADSPAAPGYLQAARVESVRQYFRENGLGSALQPPGQQPAMPARSMAPAPQGVTITMKVVWS